MDGGWLQLPTFLIFLKVKVVKALHNLRVMISDMFICQAIVKMLQSFQF